jgi:hypothetical protein
VTDATTPAADLARLRKALDDLEAMPLLEQARATPAVIDVAKEALSRHRGAVFAALAGPGRAMTITDLAKELGIGRGKVNDSIAAWRASRPQ